MGGKPRPAGLHWQGWYTSHNHNRCHPMNQTSALNPAAVLELARQVLRIEADAVAALSERLDDGFLDAVSLILNCSGRVIVSGIGKSGHIGRKIAATLACTGTPAFFVHPAEASHGDLGMITAEDVVIGISNSGESAELLNIVPSIKRQGLQEGAVDARGERQDGLALDAQHLAGQVERLRRRLDGRDLAHGGIAVMMARV